MSDVAFIVGGVQPQNHGDGLPMTAHSALPRRGPSSIRFFRFAASFGQREQPIRELPNAFAFGFDHGEQASGGAFAFAAKHANQVMQSFPYGNAVVFRGVPRIGIIAGAEQFDFASRALQDAGFFQSSDAKKDEP